MNFQPTEEQNIQYKIMLETNKDASLNISVPSDRNDETTEETELDNVTNETNDTEADLSIEKSLEKSVHKLSLVNCIKCDFKSKYRSNLDCHTEEQTH
jgi:hypothetical protein